MTTKQGVVVSVLILIVVLAPLGKAAGQCEVAKLTASDAFEFDRFGVAVGISGNVAVVGAFKDDSAADDAGSAYVFEYNGATWVELTELTASDAAPTDWFGTAVAISGDNIVVAARRNDDAGESSGAAYVFTRVEGAWSEQTKLTASDAAANDEFGWSVSIDADYLVVTAVANNNSGSAYVFGREGDEWIEQAKLTADDAAPGDNFGSSVSLSADRLVVGARNDGSAYVFRREGTRWVQEAKLVASDSGASDSFGESVSISGDYVIVGAYLHGLNNDGAAYVFHRVGDMWLEQVKLVASDASSNDNFGFSVSVSGDVLVSSAWRDDSQAGSAYVFARQGKTWVEQHTLWASDGSNGDQFGGYVFLDSDRLVVGASRDDDGGNSSGSAYIFAGLAGADCNANGQADGCDIFDGTSTDANGNGIPDECECPWDLNGDGVVNVLDLIQLVMSFGPCEGCPADFNDDGIVDVLDLIELIHNLGPCPGFDECPWDIDGDGEVDLSDLFSVLSNLGPCDDPGNCPWDFNGDGVVDGADVLELVANFGPCP